MLLGGSGNDHLIGGAGNDQLSGGAGNDIFDYPSDDPNDETANDNQSYGNDTVSDFGQGNDTLTLGDFNGDGVFDSNDYVITNTPNGALITFNGADGSRGSVLLQGVSAEQLQVSDQEDGSHVTLSGGSVQSAAELDQYHWMTAITTTYLPSSDQLT
ncbi:MAG: hypothetical protein IPL59_17660 [Candidatus Competibacteraceae bacterium]|nr:hypothetical protein [Candidatus Competibacteraceae bacterium]